MYITFLFESLTEPIPAMAGEIKKNSSNILLAYDTRALWTKSSHTDPKLQRSQTGFEKTIFRSRQKPKKPSWASSASSYYGFNHRFELIFSD